MKTILYIVLAMMSGCRPCEPQMFDMGEIPQEVLDRLPYKNCENMELVHSAGRVIQFSITHTVENKEDIICFDCCNTYLYEEARTIFHADHPVFDCSMRLNNMDTIMYFLNISIGRSFYEVPVSDSTWTYYDRVDSMRIGGRFYHKVYRLADQYHFGTDDAQEGVIAVDSLFFNFAEGILKITMTNDEYYQLVE
jgi:hypothetical protein